MNVICDTSFLMVLVSAPLKRIAKIEMELGRLNFLVPSVVIGELKRLETRAGPKRSLIARTAIEIANSKLRIVDIANCGGRADESILEFAKTSGYAVATLDRNLKIALRRNNILIVSLSNNRMIVESLPEERYFKYC
jgi:rRNA-processing protein FCF1